MYLYHRLNEQASLLWPYCLEIRFHSSKGEGQHVMEHNSFPLELQLPDRKDALKTAQKFYQLKIQSFCKCYLQYTCCLCRHLCHE